MRGIRIILDMVFNHTSYPTCLVSRGAEQRKPLPLVFIWRDGEPETPPNNWRS